jgi:hypothetical protein
MEEWEHVELAEALRGAQLEGGDPGPHGGFEMTFAFEWLVEEITRSAELRPSLGWLPRAWPVPVGGPHRDLELAGRVVPALRRRRRDGPRRPRTHAGPTCG